MKNTTYSEKQLKIISGDIPMGTIGSRTVIALYNTALANGDIKLAQRAKDRLEAAKEETRERNRQRVNRRYQF